MKGLLDTHTFLWWDVTPSRLPAQVLAFLQNPANALFLSVVSVWEILIKSQSGKLAIRAPLPTVLAQQRANGVQILPVTLDHVLTVGLLPAVHKDPFDRLLVAQANVEGAVLLSGDPVFARYPVQVLW